MVYLHLLTTLLAGSIVSNWAGPAPNFLLDESGPIIPAWQGTYTFPEIAAKLSTDESKIQCSPRLSGRAALVHLKSRSRQELQNILSRSLSVEFKPLSSSSPDLLMVPNQVIESRHDRWLADLKGRMTASMLRLLDGVLSVEADPQIVPELQILAGRSNDAIKVLLRGPEPDLRKIREKAQSAASIEWAVSLSSKDERQLLLEVYRANRLFFIGFPIVSSDFKLLPNKPQIPQALQESLLRLRPSLYSRPHWFPARWKFQRQDNCFNLRIFFAAAASGAEIQELGFVSIEWPDIYRDMKQTLRSSATSLTQSVVEVFGAETKKSLAADFAASSEFLSGSTAKRRAKLDGTRAYAQSELIDAWAQATESELIMEVSVAADGPSYANRSTALSLGDIASPSGDSVFSEYEGVVTVTDAFQFLHGRAWPPVAALVQLDRALKQKSVLEDPIRIYPWAELRTYFKRQGELTRWKDLVGRTKLGFRGLSLAEIDEAAIFALLESAVPAVRNAIAAKDADISIRLTKAMRPQLLQISSKLRGLIPQFALVDDPIQVLLGTRVRIRTLTRSDRTFIYLELDDSEGTRWLHLIEHHGITVEQSRHAQTADEAGRGCAAFPGNKRGQTQSLRRPLH